MKGLQITAPGAFAIVDVPDPDRLEIARSLGADRVLNPRRLPRQPPAGWAQAGLQPGQPARRSRAAGAAADQPKAGMTVAADQGDRPSSEAVGMER